MIFWKIFLSHGLKFLLWFKYCIDEDEDEECIFAVQYVTVQSVTVRREDEDKEHMFALIMGFKDEEHIFVVQYTTVRRED